MNNKRKKDNKSMILYKCNGKDCDYIVSENELEDHV